jgi:protein-tyrosine-phosphatase
MVPRPAALRLTVVCTANVCRSPLAAAVLDATVQLEAALDLVIDVQSAGVDVALVDERADVRADALADAFGGACLESAALAHFDAAAHRPQLLDPWMVESAALIVTMDRSQRAAVARMAPGCRPRLFTLVQAALLAEHVGQGLEMGELPEGAPALPSGAPDRIPWFVAEMDAARGALAGMGDDTLEIVDMHGEAPHSEALIRVRDCALTLGTWLARVTTLDGDGLRVVRAAEDAELVESAEVAGTKPHG